MNITKEQIQAEHIHSHFRQLLDGIKQQSDKLPDLELASLSIIVFLSLSMLDPTAMRMYLAEAIVYILKLEEEASKASVETTTVTE